MSGESRRRPAVLAGMVVALIATVALASRGHAPAGNGPTHGLEVKLVWEFFLLAVLALFILVFPVAAWMILTTRMETTRAQARRRRATWRIAFGLAFLALAALTVRLFVDRGPGSRPRPITPPTGGSGSAAHNDPGKPIPFDWLPAVVVLAVAFVGACIVGYMMFRKPSGTSPTREELAARLSEVLEDSLDDLRAERDPRRAVIATYARMERTLATAGFPRAVGETPFEYLARILQDLLHTSREAASSLTALFERAKFSTHAIDSMMKADAIDALVALRDELRNAAGSPAA